MVERPGDQFGKERLTGERRPVASTGSVSSRPFDPSRCPIGLLPRNAANSVLTGGSVATRVASAAGTDWACSPADSVCGSELARPAIIREKNTPIDSAVPEFWNVDRIPEATPRWPGGTLLMMAEVFGAENMPCPTPLANSRAANAQYGKSTGRDSSPTKAAQTTARPPVENSRAPNRSDR